MRICCGAPSHLENSLPNDAFGGIKRCKATQLIGTSRSIGADDVCFKSPLIGLFFSLGQTIPVNRDGTGVFQPVALSIALSCPHHDTQGMDFAIDRLNRGYAVQIYPEGQHSAMYISYNTGNLTFS